MGKISEKFGLKDHELYGTDLGFEIALLIEPLKNFAELVEVCGSLDDPSAFHHSAMALAGLVETLDKNLQEMAEFIYKAIRLEIVRPSHGNTQKLDYQKRLGLSYKGHEVVAAEQPKPAVPEISENTAWLLGMGRFFCKTALAVKGEDAPSEQVRKQVLEAIDCVEQGMKRLGLSPTYPTTGGMKLESPRPAPKEEEVAS